MNDLKTIITNLRLVFTLVPWRLRPKLILIFLGSVAVALLDLVAVLLMLPVMEVVMGATGETSTSLALVERFLGLRDQKTTLIVVLLIAVALMSLKSVFTVAFKWWSGGVMARAQSDVLHEVTSLYTTSPWINHRKRNSALIYQTVNFYVPATFGSVLNSGISLAVDAIAVLALMLGLLVVSPVGTGVAIVFFGGSAFILQHVLKGKLFEVGEAARRKEEESWRYLNPSIDGLKEIRLAGASEYFVRGFSERRRAAAFYNRTRAILSELPKAALEVVMILGVLVVGAVMLATMPAAQAFAFLGVFAVAAMRIVPALNRIVATLGVVRTNVPNLNAFAKDIRELQGEGRRPQLSPGTIPFPATDITFDHLTFQFPDAEHPVLDSISGVIPKGHTVALVGSSGAGKTTFVELLLTLFDPTQGRIEVDGRSIHEFPLEWRQQLGVVVQDVFLLDASIRDNITLGVPPEEVDESRLTQAIEMAQLESVIADAPQGLDTLVGSRGTRLSGGQRQRVGIARALYRNPQVLILDEATSALDNETEARITETIQALQGKMTIIVVAHRLSTVKHADQIFFFSKGKIAGRGTMDELAASNEEFSRLVELGNLK